MESKKTQKKMKQPVKISTNVIIMIQKSKLIEAVRSKTNITKRIVIQFLHKRMSEKLPGNL